MRWPWVIFCVVVVGCGEPGAFPDDGGSPPDASDGGGAGGAAGGAAGGGVGGGGVGGGSGGGFDLDGGLDAGPSDAGQVSDAGPQFAVYPVGRTHSPITDSVAAHLRRIAAAGPTQHDDVFAKIGDSNTVNTNFAACFAGTQVDLAGRTQLQPTLDFFKAGVAGATTPFNRVTLAATVGWSAPAALAGTPSPLDQELAAISPRLGVVMFGTNDIQTRDIYGYGRAMFAIADQLIQAGTVPIFTAIPPRDDDAAADLWVPRYNEVSRGIAQARQVPYVDLNRELLPITSHGIGPDGLHLNVFVSGSAKGCVFTAPALQFGNNVRNLITLQALDRAHAALSSQPAPDAAAPARLGRGTRADPIVVDALPFTDVRDTSKGGSSAIASYPACSAANEGGPEFLYRLTLTRTTNLRAFVVSLGTADVDLHLLDSTGTAAGCLARDDKLVLRSLAAGTYYLALDTFVSAGVAKSGEYELVVMEDP